MAENYRFFDSTTYTEAQFAEFQRAIMRQNGYIDGSGNELAVIQHTPADMIVIVGTGEAWIQGVWYQNTAAYELAIAAADPTNPRIDRVVIRVTWASNKIEAAILKGTAAASPSAPALTQTSSVYELSVAQITVDAGATAIHTADITDERLTSYCGVATTRMGRFTIDSDGSMNANMSRITGLINPSGNTDADNKGARDAAIAAYAPGGLLLARTIYTTGAGNHTTNAKTTKILMYMIGAGGGSGGAHRDGLNTSISSPGGSGAYLEKYVACSASTAYAYSVGTAGTAGTDVPSNGGNGGDTTLIIGATTYTAGGGSGGASSVADESSASIKTGGTGGTATNGDINITGTIKVSVEIAGLGTTRPKVSAPGFGGVTYGYGGASADGTDTAPSAGNTGGPGCIIIEEYA